MKLPLISIITPTYNAALTVEKALLSVINQQYKTVEHLFIDGGSSDETTTIIRRYQLQYPHIRLLSEKDNGLYDAINKGMVLCTGDWMYIMGADDAFYNDRVLSDIVAQGWFGKEQIVYGNVLIAGDAPWAKDNSLYDGPFTLEKLYMKNLCHQSIFYPRSVISRVGYYSNKYPVTADWDYNMHCYSQYKFAYTGLTIAIFNAGGKSSDDDVHSFFKDMPEKVIQYFQLNPRDKIHEKPDSPFYYPLALYREKEHTTLIKKLEDEVARLKTALHASQETLRQKESELGKTRELTHQRMEQFKHSLEEKEQHYAKTISDARRNTEKLRAELEEHKKVINSLVNSYTWKTGRFFLAPLRMFRKKKVE